MPSAGNVTRVLIVEDSASDGELVKAAIDQLTGLDVIETVVATSLGAAFDTLGEAPADLILLDLGLPDSYGLDTLRRMRSRLPHVPIIVFTSMYAPETGLEAVRIGAQDFLVKNDASGEMLAHAVHCALVRHQSQEHQYADTVDQELDALDRVRASLRPAFGKKD